MNDEKWEQILENLRRKFEIVDERTEDLISQTQDGPVKQGTVEMVVVRTPAGKIKLIRESRPLVLSKKFHYSHRQGQSSTVEYKKSETEKSYKLRVFRWDEMEDDWKELETQNVQGMF